MSELLGECSASPSRSGLERELMRAVKMLGFLRELLEERQRGSDCHPVCLSQMLSERFTGPAAGEHLRGRNVILEAPEDLLCWGNSEALDRVFRFIFELLSKASDSHDPLSIVTHSTGGSREAGEGRVQIRFILASNQGERLASELSCDAHLFQSSQWAFENRELPDAARVRALLEGMGGSLSAEGGEGAFTLILELRRHSSMAWPGFEIGGQAVESPA